MVPGTLETMGVIINLTTQIQYPSPNRPDEQYKLDKVSKPYKHL